MIYLGRSKLRAMAESAAWLVGRRRRVRIVGDSMLPTLAAGQFVLVDGQRTPLVGELAVARHPFEPDVLVVKRVGAIEEDGRLVLLSDNPEAGTDSRSWGPIEPQSVEGTVTMVLDNPSAEL